MFVRRILKKPAEVKKVLNVTTKRNAGGHHGGEVRQATYIALKGVESIDPYATSHVDLASLATPLYEPQIANKSPELMPDLEQEANAGVKSSKLENGFTVVSTDSFYKGNAVVSLFVDAGSRYESFANNGVSHFVQRFLYGPTNQRSFLRVATELQKTGGDISAQAGREEIVYRSESLREAVPKIWSVIANSILQTRLLDWDLPPKREAVKTDLQFYAESPAILLNEALHQAAFGGKTLGRSLICPPHNVNAIKSKHILEYMNTYFRPDRMTLVGTNISHSDLEAIAKELFGSVSAVNTPLAKEASKYTGGDMQIGDRRDGDAYCAVAFQGVGTNDAQYYAYQVLAQILGDTTNPAVYSSSLEGKNTLLYQYVTGKIPTIAKACGFSSSYSDNGLVGFCVRGTGKIDQAVNGGVEALKQVSSTVFAPEIIQGAKNKVLRKLAASMESSVGLNEFVAKNYNSSADAHIQAIQNVTAEQVKNAASKALQTKPTVVSYGNIEDAPTTHDLKI